MTWEQKLAALNALSQVALYMRKPGDWYVLASGIEVGDGHMLGSCSGDGASPEEAVLNLWHRCVDELPPSKFLVLGAMTERRREVRWNGFMWKDVVR